MDYEPSRSCSCAAEVESPRSFSIVEGRRSTYYELG